MSSQATSPSDGSAELNPGRLTDEDIQVLKEAGPTSWNSSPEERDSTDLSIDKTFELLKNQRRRRVLRYLMENGETSTTGELAEHVAVLENGKDDKRSLTSKERKAVYVGLYQCHLPKMDDYGVIRFNQARGRIELTELAYELEEYLYDGPSGTSWPTVYLAVATVGTAASVSGILLGLPLLITVSTFGVLGLIFAVALAQLYSQGTR